MIQLSELSNGRHGHHPHLRALATAEQDAAPAGAIDLHAADVPLERLAERNGLAPTG